MPTEAQIQAEFNRAVRNTVDGASFGALRDAISRGHYQAALDAVDIDDAAFDGLRAAITQTYAEGGVDAVTGTRWPANVRWNSATPQAEQFARDVLGANITYITEDMRAAVRWTMGDGIALGRSNNRVALDIVGRVGASGKREGGILGLNQQQAQWVANMRRYLETGDYAALERMGLRDKRFKFSEDKPPTAAQIERMTQAYANRLLRSRGLTIARTERGLAVNAGRIEGYRQGAAKSGIPLSALRKEWIHSPLSIRDRATHLAANGQVVVGLDTPFQVGFFAPQYPHDPLLPAGEVVNCRCQVRVTIPKRWRNG